MRRLLGLFSRLQWKLTLSYTLVTVAAILALQAATVILAALDDRLPPPAVLVQQQSRAAAEVAPYLEGPQPDRHALTTWLQGMVRGGQLQLEVDNPDLLISVDKVVLLDIVDSGGTVVSSITDTTPAGISLVGRLSPLAATVLADALEGRTDPAFLGIVDQDGRTAVATPVYGQDDRVKGALFLLLVNPSSPGILLSRMRAGILPNLLITTLLVAGVGTFFGLFFARGLAHRLYALARVTQSWGQGDFTVAVHDSSPDAVGRLGRQLNQMAEQVQSLLQAREQLAMMEERNRLARDLHDSVKQRAFATAMQVATARELLERDPVAARRHVEEAERLARQVQQELTGLIHELRPVSLQGRGLSEALREYVVEWSQRAGIPIRYRLQGARPLSLEVEQALYRVAQEALANVSRHSAASRVEIALDYGPEAVALRVADNGRGFDLAAVEGRGLGLTSMRERTAALGGVLQVQSAVGQGTRIVVQVPVLSPESERAEALLRHS